jgi:hypothetical protein
MDETSGSIVGDGLTPLFLWDQDDVGRVEPMEVLRVKIVEKQNDSHEVLFYYVPTRFENTPVNPSGPSALSEGISFYGVMDLLLREING